MRIVIPIEYIKWTASKPDLRGTNQKDISIVGGKTPLLLTFKDKKVNFIVLLMKIKSHSLLIKISAHLSSNYYSLHEVNLLFSRI